VTGVKVNQQSKSSCCSSRGNRKKSEEIEEKGAQTSTKRVMSARATECESQDNLVLDLYFLDFYSKVVFWKLLCVYPPQRKLEIEHFQLLEIKQTKHVNILVKYEIKAHCATL
jgi:hypothetical protein